MVIDVNLLKRQGKTSGSFVFPFTVEKELALSPDYEFGNAEIQCEVVINDRDVEVYGTISYVVNGQCARCLENASKQVEISFDEVFSERPQEDEYRFKSGKIDLSELVRDNVLFSQPTILLCKEDCEGITVDGIRDN